MYIPRSACLTPSPQSLFGPTINQPFPVHPASLATRRRCSRRAPPRPLYSAPLELWLLFPGMSVDSESGAIVPSPGHWPVPPQHDVPMHYDRIWIDGCFDFSHHGELAVVRARNALIRTAF